MKLKHFSLAISVTGILLLYLISKVSEPQLVEISELSDYAGKTVTVRGIVKEQYMTKYGSHVITIEDNNATAKVFAEEKTDIDYGDKIQITGEIQKYNNEWEIITDGPVRVLKKWQNLSVPLHQIAENPYKYLGVNINVTGYVEFISNSIFYLRDLEKNNSVLVEYFLSDKLQVYPGKKVQIFAKFTFDAENFRYKLVICDESHAVKYLD